MTEERARKNAMRFHRKAVLTRKRKYYRKARKWWHVAKHITRKQPSEFVW